jgi:hypothetical protein
MNNETEDAVRLEVKLFSGYYFEKMSSASVSDVHYDSHSNHIWFVFAKVSVTLSTLERRLSAHTVECSSFK